MTTEIEFESDVAASFITALGELFDCGARAGDDESAATNAAASDHSAI